MKARLRSHLLCFFRYWVHFLNSSRFDVVRPLSLTLLHTHTNIYTYICILLQRDHEESEEYVPLGLGADRDGGHGRVLHLGEGE